MMGSSLKEFCTNSNVEVEVNKSLIFLSGTSAAL